MWNQVATGIRPLTWTAVTVTLSIFFAISPCRAGGGPENVFLLVNEQSVDSISVANYYIHLRKIPVSNVLYLSYKPSEQSISGKQFREHILLPALKEIDRRKLGTQIDYLIYSCDFPWRVDFIRDYPGETFPKYQKPTTSLTGASYLWALSKEPNKGLFSPANNFYFSPPENEISNTRAFQTQYRWTQGGQRAVGKGLPYMLSAMLGVTDERGNTVDEISKYLLKASQSDGTKPKGTIYLVQNSSRRSTPRHNLFPAAVRELSLMGVQAKIIEGFFPKNRPDVMGVTTGAPIIDVRGAGCRFLPGAFCDNLTSFGGIFSKYKVPPGGHRQTNVCEYLRNGASAACGTVTEPTNLPHKFPSPFFHVHYARGCSLGEAFYRSLSGPYQQILVGDPLCQPWANTPQVTVVGIKSGDWISDVKIFKPLAVVGDQQGINRFELFIDGTLAGRCKLGGQFSLDTNSLADGHHELRVVAIDNTPIETQGRWIGEVTVKNGRHAVQLSVDKSLLASRPKLISVQVVSTTKERIAVMHNGHELGKVSEGNGVLKIEASLLGSGPVTLYAIGGGSPGIRSQPLRLELP